MGDTGWQRAMELCITVVPIHLCGGKRLAGFAAYDDFVRLYATRQRRHLAAF